MKYIVKFDEYINENNNIIKEDKVIIKEPLYIYDIDGTLLETNADVTAVDKRDGTILKIPHQEWLEFVKTDNDYYNYDFGEFDTLDCLKKAKLLPTYTDFLYKYSNNQLIGIVSARGNKQSIIDFFKQSGISNLDESLIYTVGDLTSIYCVEKTNPLRKKLAFEDLYNKGYRNIIFYDDMEDNLDEVKKLELKYNDLKIDIKLV